MASASKEWIGSNSWVSARLVVESVPNTTGNYSDVTAKLYGARNDGGTSYNTSGSNFWININGSKTTRTSGCTISGSSWQLVHTQNTRVYHNDDGSKKITISAGGGINETTFQMGSASIELTLDKIARKSSLTVDNGILGTIQAITINRQNASYTDTITYKCGDVTGTICEKTSEKTIEWTPPLELANQNTTGATVSVTLTIETYTDETSLGANVKTISYEIPDTVVPTVSILARDFMDYFSKYEAYVQGKSVLEVELTASGSYGSTITAYNTTVDGKTFTTPTFLINPIQNSGELTIETTVTDTRGRKTIESITISVLPYEAPKLVDVSSKRCSADGSSNSSGEYLAVSFDASVTPLNDKNSATYKIQYKKTRDTTYTEVVVSDYTGAYSVSDGTFIFEADKYSSYDISVSVYDNFTDFTKLIIGSSVRKVFSILAKGLGIALGKVAELEGVFEVAFKTKHTGGLIFPTLPSDVNYDDVKTPNIYVIKDTKSILQVTGEEGRYLLQRLSVSNEGYTVTYERTFENEVWGGWYDLRSAYSVHDVADFIVEYGTNDIWTYRKWDSGIVELWGYATITSHGTDAIVQDYTLPFEITSLTSVSISPVYNAWAVDRCYLNQQQGMSDINSINVTYFANEGTSRDYEFSIQIVAKYK